MFTGRYINTTFGHPDPELTKPLDVQHNNSHN